MRPRPPLAPLLLLTALLPAGAAAQPARGDAPPAPPAIRVLLDDHPALALGPDVRVELRARFDADMVALGDVAEIRGPDWSGRRVGVAIGVGRHVEGEVSRELGANQPWRDVHLTWRAASWHYIR